MDYFLRKKVPKSRIQSILISRLYYTKLKAIEWLVNHKFQHYKIHETKIIIDLDNLIHYKIKIIEQ